MEKKNYMNDINKNPDTRVPQKKTYEQDFSHSHCWNQGDNPACGQLLENHKQCCLCDVLSPVKECQACKNNYPIGHTCLCPHGCSLPCKCSFQPAEDWIKKFLRAGSQNSCGDLSIMIPIVSAIIAIEREKAEQKGMNKVMDTARKLINPSVEEEFLVREEAWHNGMQTGLKQAQSDVLDMIEKEVENKIEKLESDKKILLENDPHNGSIRNKEIKVETLSDVLQIITNLREKLK